MILERSRRTALFLTVLVAVGGYVLAAAAGAPSMDIGFRAIDRGAVSEEVEIEFDGKATYHQAYIAEAPVDNPAELDHTELETLPIESPNTAAPADVWPERELDQEELVLDRGTVDVSDLEDGRYAVFTWACDIEGDTPENCGWTTPRTFAHGATAAGPVEYIDEIRTLGASTAHGPYGGPFARLRLEFDEVPSYCEAFIDETDEYLGSCDPYGDDDSRVFTYQFTGEPDTGRIRFEFNEDGDIYQRSKPVIFDPHDVISEYEVNGDPAEKINLLVYGHRCSSLKAEAAFIPMFGPLYNSIGSTWRECGLGTNEMDGDTTRSRLQEGMDNFFGDNGVGQVQRDYRDYFNWYVVDATGLCETVDGLGGDTNCPHGLEQMDMLRDLQRFDNAAVGIMVLYDETFDLSRQEILKGFARNSGDPVDGVAVVPRMEFSPKPFTHELGHLVWGFNDEYPNVPSNRDPMRDSYFFPSSMNGHTIYPDGPSGSPETFNVYRYPNTWRTEAHCHGNVSTYYPSLDERNCVERDPDSDGGYIIRDGAHSYMDSKKSEMAWGNWEEIFHLMEHQDVKTLDVYPNHERRIRYLMEHNPKYSSRDRTAETPAWPYPIEVCNRRTDGTPVTSDNLHIEATVYNPRDETVDSVTARIYNPDAGTESLDESGPEAMDTNARWEIGTDTVGLGGGVGRYTPGYYIRTFAAPTGDDATTDAWEDDVYVWITEDDIPDSAGNEICLTEEDLEYHRQDPSS